MSKERIIGVDIGTSTSVVRIKEYQDGKPVGNVYHTYGMEFQGKGDKVPTLIRKDEEGRKKPYYGYEAEYDKKGTVLYEEFKLELESTDNEKRQKAQQLTEEFLGWIHTLYDEQRKRSDFGAPDTKERTIISYPVKWSQETQNFMKEAAVRAGFKNVSGMDEAEAAVRAALIMCKNMIEKDHLLENGKPAKIMLIDMGAGTTDIVLLTYTPGVNPKIEDMVTWPKEGDTFFGGKEVERLLPEFFLDKCDSQDDWETLVYNVGNSAFKTWKHYVSGYVKHDVITEFFALDRCAGYLGIEVKGYQLDKPALEKCLCEYLEGFPRLVNESMVRAGITGADVDLVIVTGGHSEWYFVKEMLWGEKICSQIIDLPKIKKNKSRVISLTKPQDTVALGLVYSPMTVEFEKKMEKKNSEKQNAASKKNVDKKNIKEQYTNEKEFWIENIAGNCCKVRGLERIPQSRTPMIDISIPPMINGRKVTHVEWYGKNMGSGDRIKSVKLPDTVTHIIALSGFKNLDTVVATMNVEYIGEEAFYGCDKLRELNFGANHLFRRSANRIPSAYGGILDGCVYFPVGLKFIGNYAFKNSWSVGCLLKKVKLSKKTKVEDSIFGKTFPKHACEVSYYEDDKNFELYRGLLEPKNKETK